MGSSSSRVTEAEVEEDGQVKGAEMGYEKFRYTSNI